MDRVEALFDARSFSQNRQRPITHEATERLFEESVGLRASFRMDRTALTEAAEPTRAPINARLRGEDTATFQSLDAVFFLSNDIVELNALLPKRTDMLMLAAMNMKKKGKDGRWIRGIETKEYLEMKKSKR